MVGIARALEERQEVLEEDTIPQTALGVSQHGRDTRCERSVRGPGDERGLELGDEDLRAQRST